MMPRNILLNVFIYNGIITGMETILQAKLDSNPFAAKPGSPVSGYASKFQSFFLKYYYKVYFTSKIVDGSGIDRFYINSFYST